MVAALLIKQWKKSFEVKKLKKLFDTLVDGSVALISRFLPDAYILVLLLTVILFIAAILLPVLLLQKGSQCSTV